MSPARLIDYIAPSICGAICEYYNRTSLNLPTLEQTIQGGDRFRELEYLYRHSFGEELKRSI